MKIPTWVAFASHFVALLIAEFYVTISDYFTLIFLLSYSLTYSLTILTAGINLQVKNEDIIKLKNKVFINPVKN